MNAIEAGTVHAPPPVAFGAARRPWRTPWGSGVRDTRTTLLVVAAAIIGVGVLFIALATGDLSLTLAELWAIATGGGNDFAREVVLEWRMPRVVASIVFGAALGVSGAIFQSLTRNPLGSPDIIGLNVGAFTGALIGMVFLGAAALPTAALAVAGSMITGIIVYALSYRSGLAGQRFVVVGIGMAALLMAVNSLIVLRADTRVAMVATVWGQGSLENVTWAQVTPVGIIVIAALVAAVVLSRSAAQLELGDDSARALGVRVEPARLGLIAVGIVLVAVTTSVSGPIAFLALAAPHITRSLTRSPGSSMMGAAATGAALLAVSDLVAARLPIAMPVGVVTVVGGGCYLLWLIMKEVRRS